MIKCFIKNEKGAAAAEMALVTPLLMILMFGSFELGKYFWDNHIVAKAVRDGARFASRQSFDNYNCTGTTVSDTVRDNTRNLTRTNTIDGTGTVRLSGWTNAMITVSLRCDTSGTYAAFYSGMAGVPIVSVSATVPYSSLFGSLGIDTVGLNLIANSEAPVMGI
ncbi:pilus assembly protein [Sphingorhabdus pulchriflava]|uniref:Pilus assembly protein n=1 Tax=Sphingorhabdus pulchriflava TaxID=2292257 RepID=A0A371B2C1_9SPHN|nr:TadE/TadG family type IV pilus assembly protein [Sphingorhabdus pulchriflava]RDV01682.1 pilus assembly protein [Sphingorhabdus pulchriflava]